MSENKKAKKLTIAELNKQNKKLDVKETATISIDGEDFEVKFDKRFRNSKKYQALDDIYDYISASELEPTILDNLTPYMSLLIIKHFTDINVSDDINDALDIMYTLIDLEIFDKVLNILPEEEVTKTIELFIEAMQNYQLELEKQLEEVEKIYDELENEEVKDALNNDNVEGSIEDSNEDDDNGEE